MKTKPINFNGKPPERPSALVKAWAKAKAVARPANAAETDLILYGEIGYDWWTDGGITAEAVSKFLAGLPNGTTEINVRINSPGGDVFEGIAIYNALLNSGLKVNVKIDALAASIATVIAMAGDTISMAGNGQFMIHKAWTIAMGNAEDMRGTADLLDSIDSGSIISTYVARTGLTEKEAGDMMAAETWMDAKSAKEKGFVDSIEPLKAKPAESGAENEITTFRQRNIANRMRAELTA